MLGWQHDFRILWRCRRSRLVIYHRSVLFPRDEGNSEFSVSQRELTLTPSQLQEQIMWTNDMTISDVPIRTFAREGTNSGFINPSRKQKLGFNTQRRSTQSLWLNLGDCLWNRPPRFLRPSKRLPSLDLSAARPTTWMLSWCRLIIEFSPWDHLIPAGPGAVPLKWINSIGLDLIEDERC